MTTPAIKVEGLWKQYSVGAAQRRHTTFYDLLAHSIKAPFARLRNLGGQDNNSDSFWALRDVDFEVQHGEVLGIIGRNGAGKSTLLKILSRITAPTSGRVTVQGRMASLLEVGTGFHPELSGRENIFLNGALLGMTRADIVRKLDAIVAFAEVARFIDTPVKRYSSGMYVRLAFSIAAHLEPDVLVIDEVLAVGDAAFQRQCLGKMQDVARTGRTVIFVSHNMGAITQLCSRAILLHSGQLILDATPANAISKYLSSFDSTSSNVEFALDPGKSAQFTHVSIASPDGEAIRTCAHTSGFVVKVSYRVRQWPRGSYVCLDVFNESDSRLIWSSDVDSAEALINLRDPGAYEAAVLIPAHVLAPGRYYFTVAIYSPGTGTVHDVRERIASIDISDGGSFLSSLGLQGHALTMIPLAWKTTAVPAADGEQNVRLGTSPK